MSLARLCLFALVLAAPLTILGQSNKFEVVRVAEGVYAALRREPPGFAVESNSLFVVCKDDVLVVDAQSNAAATKAVLAALRQITDKPVRYVVNTHWHDDHVVGDQVYRDAFPGVEFIAHAAVRAYLPAQGLTARQKFHEAIPATVEQLRGILSSGQNARGGPLTDEQRASLASDIALAEGYMTVPRDFEPVLPTVTLEDKLTLYHGGRTIEILYLGRGHTSGDVVVHLPQEHVVAAGDLVVWPVPLVGADQSHVGDWGATLARLLALKPAVIVPGHGPLMRDDAYVQLVARLMNSVKQQTEAAVARGETLEAARKSVNLDDLRKLFAADSPVRNTLFNAYVAGPAVASAYADATAKR
ncbi:MAG TPA: MBL fold metallo-hydrolase [Pyrinomonadaceae bacterium]|jgi:glyoxylase-like metal-dependent hydrolase (beta-lactamase superfamily II)